MEEDREFILSSLLLIATITEVNVNRITSLNLFGEFLCQNLEENEKDEDKKIIYARFQKLLKEDQDRTERVYSMLNDIQEKAAKLGGIDVDSK